MAARARWLRTAEMGSLLSGRHASGCKAVLSPGPSTASSLRLPAPGGRSNPWCSGARRRHPPRHLCLILSLQSPCVCIPPSPPPRPAGMALGPHYPV